MKTLQYQTVGYVYYLSRIICGYIHNDLSILLICIRMMKSKELVRFVHDRMDLPSLSRNDVDPCLKKKNHHIINHSRTTVEYHMFR